MNSDIRAILIKPATKNKKVNTNPFICQICSLSYPRSEYKVLYDSKKLVYFLLYPVWEEQDKNWFLCHDCFSKSVMKICEEYELPILSVKVKEGRGWYTLDFFYDGDDTPCNPEDLDLF